MAYNKAEVKNLADKVYDLLKGLKDGVGPDDVTNLVGALTAAPACQNELKEDWDAAGAHMLAQLADRFGDDRVNVEAPPTG